MDNQIVIKQWNQVIKWRNQIFAKWFQIVAKYFYQIVANQWNSWVVLVGHTPASSEEPNSYQIVSNWYMQIIAKQWDQIVEPNSCQLVEQLGGLGWTVSNGHTPASSEELPYSGTRQLSNSYQLVYANNCQKVGPNSYQIIVAN